MSNHCEIAATELKLWADNTGEIAVFHSVARSELCRQIADGTYRTDAAPAVLLSFVRDAARNYERWNLTTGEAPKVFSGATMWRCAEMLRDSFESEYRANQWDGVNPVPVARRKPLP